jgi:hypothetical protein
MDNNEEKNKMFRSLCEYGTWPLAFREVQGITALKQNYQVV